MAKKNKPDKVATRAELKRLKSQSDGLNGFTSLPDMAALSPKRHSKLLRQLDKIDRAIAKIAKLTS
jgi:hypothetical protein